MNVKPILFSGPMVRAILDGRKTQHREPLKNQDVWDRIGEGILRRFPRQKSGVPYAVGDVLWVRETWATVNSYSGPGWAYRANGAFIQPDYDGENFGAGPSFNYEKYPGEYVNWYEDLLRGVECNNWSPSIHMPKWASRLTLVVTDVRVQRLQDISEADARAEGVDEHTGCTASPGGTLRQVTHLGYQTGFEMLWDSINAKRAGGAYAWDKNPWVVALTFDPHQMNVDAYLAQREAA